MGAEVDDLIQVLEGINEPCNCGGQRRYTLSGTTSEPSPLGKALVFGFAGFLIYKALFGRGGNLSGLRTRRRRRWRRL